MPIDRRLASGVASRGITADRRVRITNLPSQPKGSSMLAQSPDQPTLPSRTVQPPISDPIYVHDCNDCLYLGDTEDSNGVPFDLYVCIFDSPNPDFQAAPCYVARYGDEGDQYYSWSDDNSQGPDQKDWNGNKISKGLVLPKVESLRTAYNLHQTRLAQAISRHPASQSTPNN